MSQLSRLAKILSAANIDISHLVALTEYLEDENVVAMLETASFEDLEPALLDRLMPLLDRQSKGAILEKILPPDGSDNSPYHLRDLATIFFIQAVSEYLFAKQEGILS